MADAALPKQMTPEATAYHEAMAWMAQCPQYFVCRENADKLNHWLAMHDLPITASNLQAAFEELTEAGELYQSAPDPRQPGPPIYKKVKPYVYHGSIYDRAALERVRADVALMTAEQTAEMYRLNPRLAQMRAI